MTDLPTIMGLPRVPVIKHDSTGMPHEIGELHQGAALAFVRAVIAQAAPAPSGVAVREGTPDPRLIPGDIVAWCRGYATDVRDGIEWQPSPEAMEQIAAALTEARAECATAFRRGVEAVRKHIQSADPTYGQLIVWLDAEIARLTTAAPEVKT